MLVLNGNLEAAALFTPFCPLIQNQGWSKIHYLHQFQLACQGQEIQIIIIEIYMPSVSFEVSGCKLAPSMDLCADVTLKREKNYISVAKREQHSSIIQKGAVEVLAKMASIVAWITSTKMYNTDTLKQQIQYLLIMFRSLKQVALQFYKDK